jgi:hypothetical protein
METLPEKLRAWSINELNFVPGHHDDIDKFKR